MINCLEKFLLKQIIRHSCPDKYSLTSKRIQCYEIYLKISKNEYLLYVKEVNSKGFSGIHLNNQDGQRDNACVPFSCMSDITIEIKTFIGLWEFTYTSAFQCVLNDWTYLNRLPVIREEMAQFFFNRRDLALKEKINVLKVLVEEYIEDPTVSFSEENLLNIIHSPRWSRHPDSAKQLAYARIILNSLKESGEIQEDEDTLSAGYLYKLTGKALTTLETYNREKKRHNQIRNLTFALVVVGLIQAAVAYFHK